MRLNFGFVNKVLTALGYVYKEHVYLDNYLIDSLCIETLVNDLLKPFFRSKEKYVRMGDLFICI